MSYQLYLITYGCVCISVDKQGIHVALLLAQIQMLGWDYVLAVK